MYSIELVAMSGGGAVIVGMVLLLARQHHRRVVKEAAVVPIQPRSLVRLLNDEDELNEALLRAARFERWAAEVCRSRADRYESMLAPPASVSRAPESAA
jgi:hypothetical protein